MFLGAETDQRHHHRPHVGVEREDETVVAAVLAFSAGAFICIALSDLLPEVHFHSHDKTKLTLAFMLGIILAYAIGSVEPDGAHLAGSHSVEEVSWSSE